MLCGLESKKKNPGSGTANLEFRAESKEHWKVRAIESYSIKIMSWDNKSLL